DAADTGHLGLPAELAVSSHFTGDTCYFGREDAQLLDHRVDDGGGAKELAFEWAALDVEAHGLEQVALGDGRDCPRKLGRRTDEVVNQGIERDLHFAPRAARTRKAHPLTGFALLAHHLAYSRQFLGHHLVGRNDFVESI